MAFIGPCSDSRITFSESSCNSPIASKRYENRDKYNQGFLALSQVFKLPHFSILRNGDISELRLEMNRAGDCDLYEHSDVNDFRIRDIQLIAKQILEGLVDLHSKGYVHLDIKIENVCVEGRSQIEIIDMDLLTKINEVTDKVGTLGFAHPRRFFNTPGNPRDDLFGVGISMFEAYTKQGLAKFFCREELQEEVINNFKSSLNRGKLKVFNEMNEKDQKFIAKTLICIHEYERAFGGISPEMIFSFVEFTNPLLLCMFDFIFEYIEEVSRYELRDLRLKLPEFNWKNEVFQLGEERGETIGKVSDFVDMVESLCSYDPKSMNLSATSYLNDPFFQQSIKFKVQVNKKYSKKGYELIINDPSDEHNYIKIDLDANLCAIQEKCLHLLPNEGGRFNITVREKLNPDNKSLEIENYYIKEDSLVQVRLQQAS